MTRPSRRLLPARRQRDPDGRMSLADHLREFRRRVLIAFAALILCSIIGWFLFDTIYAQLTEPMENIAAQRGEDALIDLNYAGLTSAFAQRLSISIWAGTILSSPIWLWQIWAFVVPGLTRKEKRRSLAFVAAMVPLFLAGCWMAYVTLPKAVEILISFTPDGAANLPEAALYFSFVTRFILVFGLAFLFPVLLVGLNVMRVLPAQGMIKGWRPAVVAIAVFSAVATPTPDPFTMLLLAVPLVVLYFAAYLVARLLERQRDRDRPDWIDTPDDQASAL